MTSGNGWLIRSATKGAKKTKTNTGARRVSAIKLSNRGKENVSEFFGNPFGTVISFHEVLAVERHLTGVPARSSLGFCEKGGLSGECAGF